MSATPLAKARAKKAAETALPPEAYRQAVDQADLAISITDAKANILFANEAFTRVTGYGKEEIVGKNEAMLSNHTTPPELYKTMWADLSAQKPWTGKLLNKRKDGGLYLAELDISPVVDDGGKTTHFVGIHRDITEMHRLQRLVSNQKHLIESVVDARRALGQVLGGRTSCRRAGANRSPGTLSNASSINAKPVLTGLPDDPAGYLSRHRSSTCTAIVPTAISVQLASRVCCS